MRIGIVVRTAVTRGGNKQLIGLAGGVDGVL